MNTFKSSRVPPISRLLTAGVLLVAWNTVAAAASISFDTDPFEGTTVRNTPGRQVVGGEFFIAFHTATETFLFNGPAFGLTDLRFANGPTGSIPADANVVVLQTTDNDNNPLTPFGAANAADLLATRITVAGPGLFIYFNSSLNLPRLVYSDDLSSNTADLRILARMLNLNGQTGLNALNALPAFSASNFVLAETSSVPEPSSFLIMGGGLALLALGVVRRRSPWSSDILQRSSQSQYPHAHAQAQLERKQPTNSATQPLALAALTGVTGQELEEAMHATAATRAGGAVTHGAHLLPNPPEEEIDLLRPGTRQARLAFRTTSEFVSLTNSTTGAVSTPRPMSITNTNLTRNRNNMQTQFETLHHQSPVQLAWRRRSALVAGVLAAAVTLAAATDDQHSDDRDPSPAKLVEVVRNATRQP